MGDIISSADFNIPHKYDLDNFEVYGEDGQTVKSIDELTKEDIELLFREGGEDCVDQKSK